MKIKSTHKLSLILAISSIFIYKNTYSCDLDSTIKGLLPKCPDFQKALNAATIFKISDGVKFLKFSLHEKSAPELRAEIKAHREKVSEMKSKRTVIDKEDIYNRTGMILEDKRLTNQMKNISIGILHLNIDHQKRAMFLWPNLFITKNDIRYTIPAHEEHIKCADRMLKYRMLNL